MDDASTRVDGSGVGSGGAKAKEEAGGEGEEEVVERRTDYCQ